MATHLTDEQIVALAAGDAAEAARAHAGSCAACAAEVDSLAGALAGTASAARETAERPADFWRAQRLAISARVAKTPGPYARVAWTMAFAAMLLAAVTLNQPPAPERAEMATFDPDHELLVQVEKSMRRRVPDALAPAELLVAEMNSAIRQEANP